MKNYYRLARTHRYSVLFALPLLVLYESLAALLSGQAGVRNGADVILKSGFIYALGDRGPVLFGVCLVLGAVAVVWRDMRKSGGRLERRVFGLMLAESAVLAVLFGGVVGVVTAKLLGVLGALHWTVPAAWHPLAATPGGTVQQMGKATQVMVGLGAGLYEELLFRVLLVGAIGGLARRGFGWGPRASGTLAVVSGALIFSAFHYVGPYGDPFTIQSFAFRAIAGLFFSGLYVLRGFGITAWTHALYDVFLMLFGI